MAIFHLNAKVLGRSQGRSATGAAAYRAGVRIVDERTGLVFDYTRKRGVDGAEILTPDGSTPDRSAMWNSAELADRRIDSQICREVEVALMRELTPEQNRDVVRAFVREQFVAAGMVADVAFHHLTGNNPHAHILLTLREWQGGAFGRKRRDWNDRALCVRWRERWAHHANAGLEQAKHVARVDHRTLAEQAAAALDEDRHADAIALDRAPTIHERGIPRAIQHNAAVRQANANRLAAWAAIGQAAHEAGRLVPAATDATPRSTAAGLAAEERAFSEAMRSRVDPKALRWRFHDDQARAAAEWLAGKEGGDARRLAAHDAAARAARLAGIAWQVWQEEHPRPFWPWRWSRWRRQQAEARAPYESRRRAAKRAACQASPEAIEAWRAAYRVKEAEQTAAHAARRAIASTPSEEAQARSERQDRRRVAERAQATAWARQRPRQSPSTNAPMPPAKPRSRPR